MPRHHRSLQLLLPALALAAAVAQARSAPIRTPVRALPEPIQSLARLEQVHLDIERIPHALRDAGLKREQMRQRVVAILEGRGMEVEAGEEAEHVAKLCRQADNPMVALAERENVICKISGIVAGAGEGWAADDLAPPISHCLDAFGPGRMVFGGDWPVCTLAATYRQWLEALKRIIAPRSEEEQRKLLLDNAVRFYGLEQAGAVVQVFKGVS